ncbi:cytochrome P450 oxidoreductase [Mytilinidion resinicola]|uniref:Cytochrome P450 oxidoreductase n=1 Tax=Mytilinidion resinicola TaxID=574789 RepID=A0A6A6YN15_9PEZI|nr:cytochrome P450 oxidoreductase [Mytilinidion resinicola]KAF2809394.1 cytochrome P450 oxidoreductase [Mytilinidion resinicola]
MAQLASVALVAIVAIVALASIYVVVRAIADPLRGVPGPFWARFSRLWYLREVYEGPIVRITPNEYSIDDPAAEKTIYGLGTKFYKSPWYIASGNPDPTNSDLFTERHPAQHALMRRKVANLYSANTLLRLFVQRLNEVAATGRPINVQHWLQCYAFDGIGYITLSKRFGFLDRCEDARGMFTSLHSYLKYASRIGVVSEVHPIASKLLAKLGSGGMSHMMSFVGAQLQDRQQRLAEKEGGGTDDDFVSRILAQHKADPEKFTFTDVFSTCITNIGAGSDKTSISLSAVMYHLIRNPNMLAELRSELDEKLQPGKTIEDFSFQDAQRLPYLQACIKEALSVHPATGLPLGGVVLSGGAEILGVFFPAGTVIGINTWDAALYRPERWLINDKQQLSRIDGYYLPFGHGSRTCIGKNISLLEMSKLVPVLVYRFDFDLVRPEEELECQNVWFVKQKNINCRVSLR